MGALTLVNAMSLQKMERMECLFFSTNSSITITLLLIRIISTSPELVLLAITLMNVNRLENEWIPSLSKPLQLSIISISLVTISKSLTCQKLSKVEKLSRPFSHVKIFWEFITFLTNQVSRVTFMLTRLNFKFAAIKLPISMKCFPMQVSISTRNSLNQDSEFGFILEMLTQMCQ